jgi:hypothetical protein
MAENFTLDRLFIILKLMLRSLRRLSLRLTSTYITSPIKNTIMINLSSPSKRKISIPTIIEPFSLLQSLAS